MNTSFSLSLKKRNSRDLPFILQTNKIEVEGITPLYRIQSN